MIILNLLIIALSSLVLIKAADITIVSLSRLAKATKTGSFFLSAIIIAMGTSFPELFIGITSALDGTPNLSFGNVIGANITNIAWVAGIGALIFKRIKVQGEIIRKDLSIALMAGLIPFVLILDGELSRVDGLILLSVYGVYASSLFRARYMQIAQARLGEEDTINRLFRRLTVVGKNNYHDIGKLFLGLSLLLVSAEVIVKTANTAAVGLGVPVFLVGLIILALGTTLPELAFSIRSLTDHHPTMFFGNLLGSVIANSTLVVGTTALIAPIRILAFDNYLVAFIAFLASFLVFWLFTRTKQTLERWEALVLMAIYIAFVIVEFA